MKSLTLRNRPALLIREIIDRDKKNLLQQQLDRIDQELMKRDGPISKTKWRSPVIK